MDMEDVVFDERISNGEWPASFAGGWITAFYDEPSTDIVVALYVDDSNPQGTVMTYPAMPADLPLPAGYVSWMQDGTCREIYVHPDFRRRGIGSALCAWARYFAALKCNIVFKAPDRMTPEAQAMFRSLSSTYGEPYTDPEDFPVTVPYSYWGGYFIEGTLSFPAVAE